MTEPLDEAEGVRVITPDHELGVLLAASPAFAEVWGDRALGPAARAERGPWLLHAFAVHTSYLIANRQLDLVPPVFDVVEWLLVEGDERVKDHVICYFLEGIWVELKKRKVSPATIHKWVGPETREWLDFLRKALPEAMSE